MEEVESLKREQSVRKYTNKEAVMKKLEKCKTELLNERTKTVQDLNMSLKVENALAVEFPSKNLDAHDPPYVHKRRGDMLNLIEDLINQVKYKGDQVIVVDVKTPAVDMERKFNPNQLTFMRDEIFKGIKTEIGTNIQSTDTEKQWREAFQAMLSIVEIEKQKSKKDIVV